MKPSNILISAMLTLGQGLAPGLAQAGAFCVINSSETAYYFVGESSEGVRVAQDLAPKDALCVAEGDSGGVVSVFVDENAMEGCSRLVVDGQIEQLLAYSEFDRCRWASNDG